MNGYADSIAFEINNSTLNKLNLIGVIQVVKNNLILDNESLNEFIERRAKKSQKQQLLELRNLYQYLGILHTVTGLQYRISQHKTAKNPIITFRGLFQGSELSELMQIDLMEFLDHFQEEVKIVRLDICIDSNISFDIEKIASNSKRIIARRWNTIYLKTAKEKRVNQYVNIKHYYKKEICKYRLEFSFLKKFINRKNPLELIKKNIEKIVQEPVNILLFRLVGILEKHGRY